MFHFYRTVWITYIVFALSILTFGIYIYTENQIDKTHEQRHYAHELIHELRQSSDDLNRMARTYILTRDPIYKRHFQEILDIREGMAPHPIHYDHIYWDLVLSDDKRPRGNTAPIALVQMMSNAGFTKKEFEKFSIAKEYSDELALSEYAAMYLIESDIKATKENRYKAYEIVFDAKYRQTKYKTMKAISEFSTLVENRTDAAIYRAERIALIVRLIFIALSLFLTFLLWRISHLLENVLGCSISQLHAYIVSLGSGEYPEPTAIAKGHPSSVLGWLAQTQSKLLTIENERMGALREAQRLAQMYNALSQCTQAIIHSKCEEELFQKICQNAVTFGSMKMAWIGMSDEKSKLFHPIAYAGEGTDYLKNLHVSIDENSLYGKGPTGTAFRENSPYWCQDFQNDPKTAAWHVHAENYGWQSSAALPIHRNGHVVGTLSLYSNELNTFDESIQKLILEMTMDISFALDNFDRETQHKKSNNELSKLTQAMEQSPNAVIITDFKANIEYVNSAFIQNTGYTLEEVLGQNPRLLKSGITPEHAYDSMWTALSRQKKWQGEFINKRKDGTNYIYSINVAPVIDHTGKTTHYIAIEEDISEQKKTQEKIHYLANYDVLTGLPNRIQMDDHLQYILNLAKRNEGNFAILFLDLDHFKSINDTLGHSVGDLLLIELAKRLSAAIREEDTVSRMGGDEFILLLPQTDANGAAQVAQKLLASIANTFLLEYHKLSVTASIGIALYPSDGTDIETLSKNADVAMYRAKQEGRNAYRFFTHEMQKHSQRNLEISNALHTALQRDEFHLVYQPQLSTKNNDVIGAEALIRWEHPELGSISPAEFIPIAENNGTIISIGEWVLRTAIVQAAKWQQNTMPLIMAVNLSTVQFRHPNLPNIITSILHEAGLSAQYLEIELTEGVAMNDPQDAIKIMNTLHEIGVRMSIDDFGTGYSSLAYLKQFKVYKLKIDQSFVRDISTDPEDKAIVNAVIQLAHSLDLITIAEGVETIEQLHYLQTQGCDEIQGYYYSKPISATMFETFYQSHLISNTIKE